MMLVLLFGICCFIGGAGAMAIGIRYIANEVENKGEWRLFGIKIL